MKSNADKCHLLAISNRKFKIKIGSHEIANTKREKLLGVHLDSELSVDYWIYYLRLAKKQAVKLMGYPE